MTLDFSFLNSGDEALAWEEAQGWKSWLNNLRLILLPWVSANLLQPWLDVFPVPELEKGFQILTRLMNQFRGAAFPNSLSFSSA